MAEAVATTIDVRARDLTGQKRFVAKSVSRQSSVGEMVDELIGRMGLGKKDRQGQQLSYKARLEREGRQLHDSELVGDALENDDQLTVVPSIQAG